ncbi:MAG: hypothetical protein RL368_2189 [Pseudomonadota bacterium]|jgi:hypothetical protein
MFHISNAEYVDNFKIALTFNNDKQGILDFQPFIFQDSRPIFQDLRDESYFKQFKLQSGTLCWSNELDFAPEFLFFQTFKGESEYQVQFGKWGYN